MPQSSSSRWRFRKVLKNLTPSFCFLTNTRVIPTSRVERIRYHISTWHKLGRLCQFSSHPPNLPLCSTHNSSSLQADPQANGTKWKSPRKTHGHLWAAPLQAQLPEESPSRVPWSLSTVVENHNQKVLIMEKKRRNHTLTRKIGRGNYRVTLGTKGGKRPRDNLVRVLDLFCSCPS